MKYILILIVLAATYYFSSYENTHNKPDDVDRIITNIDDIENAKNVDEVVESTESFNKNAADAFQQIKVRAKSPATIQFVELTDKQNQLAGNGMLLTKKMQPLVNSMTPELANDPDKLSAVLIPLCTHLHEYIPVFSEIVQIISTKSELVHEHPIISTELMDGNHNDLKQILTHMLSSQNRILKEEKQAYIDLRCDEYLALKEQGATSD